MDVDSEVTADNLWDKGKAWAAKKWEDGKQFVAGVKKDIKKLGAETGYQARKVVNNIIAFKQQYWDKNPKKANETRKKIKDDRKATTRKKKQYDAQAREYKAKSEGRKRQIDRNLKAKEENDRQRKTAKKNRDKEAKQAINFLKQQIKTTKDPKKKKELQAKLDSVEPHFVKEIFKSGAESIANFAAGKAIFNVVNKGLGGALEKGFTALAGSTTATVGGLFLLTSQNMGTNDETDIYSKYKNHPEVIPIFNKSKDISPKEANYIKEKYPQYYSDYKIANRINPNKTDFDKHRTDLKVAGTYSMKEEKESGAKVLGTMAGFLVEPYVTSGIKKAVTKGGGAVINVFKPKNLVTQMTAAESRAARQGAIILEEGADGVFRVPENAVISSKNIPKSLPHTTASSTTEAISYTRNVERIAQTAGNAAKNLKTPVIEYKASSKPAVIEEVVTNVEEAGSKGGMKLKLNLQLFASKNNNSGGAGNGVKKSVEPPVKDSDKIYTLGKNKVVESQTYPKPAAARRVTTNIEITGSKGKNVEIIKKIDGNTTITIEKHIPDIPPAYIIDDMAKGGMGRTSGIGSGSYFENYGGGKASNEVPLFANRENIHRNNSTQNYEFKSQNNGSSGSNSGGGGSGSKKSIEPPVKDNSKTYTLESQNANWNFNSEIPKTAVKNSDGTYSLIKDNNWNFSKDYIQSYENIVTAEPKIYDVTTNSYKLPNIYTGLSSVNTNNIPLKNSSISMSYASEYGQVINTPSSLTPKMQEVLNNGDSSGKIKEKIIKNTFNRDPRYKIHDGTYGNEKHGFDVVLEDKVDNTVWIINSKPIKEPKRFNIGSTRVSNDGAGNTRQLSPNWIDTVINQKLDINHPTSILIKNARKNGDLRTGIMGINKNPNTGEPELIIIPVNIKNK